MTNATTWQENQRNAETERHEDMLDYAEASALALYSPRTRKEAARDAEILDAICAVEGQGRDPREAVAEILVACYLPAGSEYQIFDALSKR